MHIRKNVGKMKIKYNIYIKERLVAKNALSQEEWLRIKGSEKMHNFFLKKYKMF